MIASDTQFNVLCMAISLKGGGCLSHMPALFHTAIIKEGVQGHSVWYGMQGYQLVEFDSGLCGMAVTVDMFTKQGRIRLYTDIPTSDEYSSEEIREFAAQEVNNRPYRDIQHFMLRCNH